MGESAILVDPWKLHEIVSAMKILIDNIGERERLISAGYENAKKFTWEKAGEETRKVLDN